MRIAEYKKVGEHTEQRERVIPAVFNENGEIIELERIETYEVIVPEMGLVYRDATAEEEEQARLEAENMPVQEPTVEEQLADLAEYMDILTEMVLGVE